MAAFRAIGWLQTFGYIGSGQREVDNDALLSCATEDESSHFQIPVANRAITTMMATCMAPCIATTRT